MADRPDILGCVARLFVDQYLWRQIAEYTQQDMYLLDWCDCRCCSDRVVGYVQKQTKCRFCLHALRCVTERMVCVKMLDTH